MYSMEGVFYVMKNKALKEFKKVPKIISKFPLKNISHCEMQIFEVNLWKPQKWLCFAR